MTPIRERVVVRMNTTDEINGILLPDDSKQERVHGTVEHIGCEVEHVKVGDHVILPESGGINLYDGRVLIKESEILAVCGS